MTNMISKDLNERQIQQSDIPRVEQTYSNLFREVTKLNENDVICRSNCHFCTHPARQEAEKKWDQMHGSYPPVMKFFKRWEEDHPDHAVMSDQAVRNHLLKHYAKQEKRMWLKEYVSECQEYMKYRINLDQKFDMLSAVFEKQLFDVGSSENLDPIKQSDQMVKLGKMLIEIQECQAKLRGDLKPVNVMQEKLMNVWFHVINNQHDQRVKTQLMSALDTFQQHVQGEGV